MHIVSRNRFEFINIIGRGGFGKVWKVFDKKRKCHYALKQMLKVKVIDKKSENSIKYERTLLSLLHNPFLINMHFAFQDYDHLYLVLDLLPGGDLRYHLSRHRKFPERQSQFFLACILQALEYIHSKHIIHRDIKPENLVFDERGFLHVTDFGIAKRFSPSNNTETSGTPGYMAPEVMRAQNHTYLVDYFAVGVMGYEFMMGRRPYVGKNRKEIKEQIMARQAEVKEEEVEGWSAESVDFVNRLLQRKPECRLGYNGVKEIKEHKWFRGFQWRELEEKRMVCPFVPERKENYDRRYCEGSEKVGMETKERYEKYRNSQRYHLIFEGFYYCDVKYREGDMEGSVNSNGSITKVNSRTIEEGGHSRGGSCNVNHNVNNNVSTSNSSVGTYKYRNARNGSNNNSNRKQCVRSYDYNSGSNYEQEYKKCYNSGVNVNGIRDRLERNNSNINSNTNVIIKECANSSSKKKRCSSALNGAYSPSHYNYMFDKDKHNNHIHNNNNTNTNINSNINSNTNSNTVLHKNISNINLIPSSFTTRSGSVNSIRKPTPSTHINIPHSNKLPTSSYNNHPHRYTNSCSNILSHTNTQHRRYNSNSTKELKTIEIDNKSSSSKMLYQGIKSYIPKGNTTPNPSSTTTPRSTQLQKYLINNNISHLTLNHNFINTSHNPHNNISYSVVNNPNTNNSSNTIQYKYQIGKPPLSSSNSATKSRIPLPSSPRNSSNSNYYLNGNRTTANHNSLSRQNSRINNTNGNNKYSSNNTLNSSRKNYCLHKNNSVYNLSKCIPSTCSRPPSSSGVVQQKRNNSNIFKHYKVSSSSSYSTSASANKNAK